MIINVYPQKVNCHLSVRMIDILSNMMDGSKTKCMSIIICMKYFCLVDILKVFACFLEFAAISHSTFTLHNSKERNLIYFLSHS